MKLYLVEYCNGQPYEDYWRTVVGVYTTPEKALKAGNTAVDLHKEPDEDEGYYEIKLIVVDEMIGDVFV